MQTAQFRTENEPAPTSYTIGPPLQAKPGKPPWRPHTAGVIAFFFGPLAGALVVIISLRRMGHSQRAKKVLLLALSAAIVESGVLLFIPDILGRFVAVGAEIAFYLVFPPMMQREFNEWLTSNPSIGPASGWRAIHWGIIGIVLFVLILFVVTIVLGTVVSIPN